MIKLYTWKTPNGFKIPIMLAELGEEYELIPINIGKNENKTPEYLAMDPNGKIPMIVDEDAKGGPLTIFESGAILEYLAEKSGKLMPKDVHGKYLVMEWVMFQMAAIGPMMGQYGHFVRFAPEKVPYAIKRYTDEVNRLLGVLNTRLGEADYLAGEYSIADIATWPWVRMAKGMEGITIDEYPNLTRWIDAIAGRPAVTEAIERVESACV